MGWEDRGGRSYYYRKTRTPDGRVVSEYVGAGSWADLLAQYDAALRARSELDRIGRRTREAEAEAALAAYDAFARFARLAVRARMILGGFRLHKRQWRRRRRPLPQPRESEPMPDRAKTPPPLPESTLAARMTFNAGGGTELTVDAQHGKIDPSSIKATEELIGRCNRSDPDQADLDALRRWVQRDGAMMEAEQMADGAAVAVLGNMQNGAAETLALQGLQDLRRRMGYDEADPAERLLIAQVGVAWALLQEEQGRYARVLAGKGGYSLAEAEACDRRIQRASGRFIRAVESLEKIRALRRRFPAESPSTEGPSTEGAVSAGAASAEALPPHGSASGDGAAPPASALELIGAGAPGGV